MRPRNRVAWQLLPASLVFALFFALPLGFFVIVSFWRLRSYQLVADLSLHNYVQVYAEYGTAIVFTLALALFIGVITTVLGFLIAYLARFRAGAWGQAILFVVMITLFGGYLVKIFAWKTILGTRGVLNNALLELGVISQPLEWLLYSPAAVVITLVHFLLPFTVLPIYGSLRGVQETPLLAARDLGATSSRIMRDMILPQCQPGLFAAFAISFLISAGDYVTPRLVGGTNTFMVGNFIESQFINRLNAPIGAALSFVVLVLSALILIVVRRVMKRLLDPG